MMAAEPDVHQAECSTVKWTSSPSGRPLYPTCGKNDTNSGSRKDSYIAEAFQQAKCIVDRGITHECDGRADRQMDRLTDSICCAYYAAQSKNEKLKQHTKLKRCTVPSTYLLPSYHQTAEGKDARSHQQL